MAVRIAEHRTLFLVAGKDGIEEREWIERAGGARTVPFSADNNLLAHHVVLLPSAAAEFGSPAELLASIREFVHRYVALSPSFEAIASAYAIFTWIYDAFNEVPYLRVRGDFGTGKSRFLQTVGSICYKPIFASGASTISPVFRILDAFRGTLVIDESDFRASDEKAEMVKILNNGNARGFPVLRSEATPQKEFNPTAFEVFGPKIIASRGLFDDRALESRCITEELGTERLRREVPLNLPDAFHEEAEQLRNKLLLFRFRHLDQRRDLSRFRDITSEPRVAQIIAPLLASIDDPDVRAELVSRAQATSGGIVSERGLSVEAQVLQLLAVMRREGEVLALKVITDRFAAEHGSELERPVVPRWMGWVLRARLGLGPVKSHGVYVIPVDDYPKLDKLVVRYRLGDVGDVGDVATDAAAA